MDKNKTPRDENGYPHGLWELYHRNGWLCAKGCFIHGKEYGLWERYHFNGKLHYKIHYINGVFYGFSEHKYTFFHLGEIIYVTNKNKFLK